MFWSGTSKSRPNSNVYRAPDADDWQELLKQFNDLANLIGQDVQEIYENEVNENINQGQPVTFNSFEKLILANKNNPNVVGVSLNSCNVGGVCLYITQGKLTLSNWENVIIPSNNELLPGSIYYLNMNFSGKLTLIPPNEINEIIVPIGIAHTNNLMEIKISSPIYL
ncbi:MAG: hypothetical protein A3K77_04580 [Euryarchaeota archaeon RBG_13_31_8]|nr:MAG: hypothetical protein A3K77_04580 [Euryarchaeota archaeon RBG_13_31_8]